MIDFCDLVEWYENCLVLAIKKGNIPKDVTVEEASEYMEFVYCKQQSKPGVENE